MRRGEVGGKLGKEKNQSWPRLLGTSIIHSGSMSCFANHLRASAAFSFEAPRTSRFSSELEPEAEAGSVSSRSSSSSSSGSGSGSGSGWDSGT